VNWVGSKTKREISWSGGEGLESRKKGRKERKGEKSKEEKTEKSASRRHEGKLLQRGSGNLQPKERGVAQEDDLEGCQKNALYGKKDQEKWVSAITKSATGGKKGPQKKNLGNKKGN